MTAVIGSGIATYKLVFAEYDITTPIGALPRRPQEPEEIILRDATLRQLRQKIRVRKGTRRCLISVAGQQDGETIWQPFKLPNPDTPRA